MSPVLFFAVLFHIQISGGVGGESDALVSGRDGRGELSIGETLLATEALAITGALDSGMVFCTDAGVSSTPGVRLWRVA